MKAPIKIYLQVCGSCPLEGVECEQCKFEELEEVTWNTEKVYDKDVEYIRKDELMEWAEHMNELYPAGAFKMMIDKINSL